ncbi:MAG TPA: chemotaxis protein CheW [Acidisoma sp.]|jgi:chemotaxis signal transduction protein|nr:chemotaxis protein CheW [Acidisoma sp.]
MKAKDESAAAILDRRTTALATRAAEAAAEAEAASRRRPIIVAGVEQSLLGFEIAEIAAVIPFAGCARMPMREPVVMGVVGRSGRFYSVIGLRRWLGLSAGDSPEGTAEPAHLLLLRGAAPHLALAVDRVLGRFDLAVEDAAFSLDGRLVALFDVPALRSRLNLPGAEARP